MHYYTPWQFAGMTKDESWGKMQATWGSASDVAELNRLFDAMQEFCKRNDIPAFIGEFGVTDKKETPSRVRWMSAVAEAALSRKMVPVLWDTGGDISRKPPYARERRAERGVARSSALPGNAESRIRPVPIPELSIDLPACAATSIACGANAIACAPRSCAATTSRPPRRRWRRR